MGAGISIDYDGHPKRSFEDLMGTYSNVYFYLDDILKDKKSFEEVYQDLLDLLKYKFEDPKIRNMPIKFYIHHGDEKNDKGKKVKPRELTVRHFLSNLILWYAFMECDCYDIMDETFIFNFKNASQDDITNYMDDMILPNITDIDFHTQSRIIDEITHHMTAISRAFSPIFGLGVSVYSIIQADKRNPRIGELMHEKLDPNLQPVEIEKELNARTSELIDLFVRDSDNDLKSLFQSGNNLSTGQFKEIAIMIGLKSDINGTTVPHLIDRNILVDGLNTPSAYYLDAMSGRKSLIMSKTKMGEPGAFSKKATTAATAVQLRRDYLRCNTSKPVTYHINDDKFLKMLDRRYYYDENGELKMLNYKKDKDLIGHDIMFRSPCTCASKDGICSACYGGLFELNKDLYSAGAYAAMKVTEPLGQRVLSSKHLQMTHSDPIVMSDEFQEYFELYSNDITMKSNIDSDEELFIQIPEILKEETEDTVDYYCTSFNLMDFNGKTLYPVCEKSGAKLYLSDQLASMVLKQRDPSRPISLDAFDDDSAVLFNVEVKSQELTKPIKNINRLLNTNDRMGCETIDEVLQTMAEQQLEAGIDYNFVHMEMLVRSLIRKRSNVYEEPDFGPNGDLNDYIILRLNDALFKNPSPVISLSYGYLKKQLLSPEFYEKHKTSHLDPLFVSNVASIIPDTPEETSVMV